MNKKFEVTYSLPYRHYVTIGVSARNLAAGIRKVSAAFDDASLWEDKPAMPILDDDFVEEGDAGEPLKFEGCEVAAFIPRSTVLKVRREHAAHRACEVLVAAYKAGKGSGSVVWEDIDAAYVLALRACDAIDQGSEPLVS
jgi:hypothetical protein